MALYAIPVCESFKDGKCKKRLDYYVEREVTDKKLVIEHVPCIFYIKGDCGIKNGLIGHYIVGYPQPKTFERKNGKEEEIKRPLEKIGRAHV